MSFLFSILLTAVQSGKMITLINCSCIPDGLKFHITAIVLLMGSMLLPAVVD